MKNMSKAMYGKTMMQDGGMTRAEKKEARQGRKARTKELINEGIITPIEGVKLRMQAAKERRKEAPKTYKTGGMVNSNAKVSADKTPGSKGVKSGTNPKASASKVAKGRVGGTSAAPKTATPKAMYGMSMKPGMMKMGGAKKK